MNPTMKIEQIRTYLLESPLQRPFAYSRGWVDRRSAVLVEVTTDTGLTGWGEAFGPGRMAVGALNLIRPQLTGADPLQTAKIWDEFYGRYRDHGQKGPLIDALSAIDIALWDIKGKHFGQSISRLLGGPLRTQVPAYASGLFRYRDGDIDDNLTREAERHVETGFARREAEGRLRCGRRRSRRESGAQGGGSRCIGDDRRQRCL